MDGMVFTVFVLAAFVGGFVSGFSGFAMGLVVSGVWLHIITPIQTATLIAGYGLLTQGYGIFKLRHALRWQNVWPLTLGSAIGIPIGVMLLTYTNPAYVRFGVGVLLVLYTAYALLRPAFKPMKDRRRSRHPYRHGERGPRRADRTWRRYFDHLLPDAGLAERHAARGVPARAVRGLRDHFDFDEFRRRRDDGNAQIVWARCSVHGGRLVGRF
jgi:Predicted permeases